MTVFYVAGWFFTLALAGAPEPFDIGPFPDKATCEETMAYQVQWDTEGVRPCFVGWMEYGLG